MSLSLMAEHHGVQRQAQIAGNQAVGERDLLGDGARRGGRGRARAAAASLSVVPPSLVAILAQRHFVRGLFAGAVKA